MKDGEKFKILSFYGVALCIEFETFKIFQWRK